MWCGCDHIVLTATPLSPHPDIMLKSFFRRSPAPPSPRVPDDVRVYAIGDIHGCSELLDILLDKIDADHSARSPKRRIIVLLGDLVDRGPDSAGVIERAIALCRQPGEAHVIAGNHEELFHLALGGDREALKVFVRAGGRETVLSYGVAPDVYNSAELGDLADLMLAHVPSAHRDFLTQLEDIVEIGDYAFVHAGIRPGVALDAQDSSHLRWIRSEFLEHRGAHPKMIVHGHTITNEVDVRPNRIGIDTGAYKSGRLTALALDEDCRWFIDTSES